MQTNTTNSFLCQYWDAIACNPDNWTYKPSAYGVSGVEMVGDIHMKLWKDLSHWRNPGRANGVDLAKVEELKQDIQDEGIRLDTPVIYYDVDTNETINGDHRFTVSSILNIPGWMCQAVRFESVASKIRFATASNIKKRDVYNPISASDVNAAVRELVSIGAIVTDDVCEHGKLQLSLGKYYLSCISSSDFKQTDSLYVLD